MVGKASLIVIIGFSLVFGIAGMSWNRDSTNAVLNEISYYDEEVAHGLAVDGAYLACDSLVVDPAKDTSMTMTFYDGSNSCTVTSHQVVVNNRNDCLITAVSNYTDGTNEVNDTVKALWQVGNFAGYAMFTQNENGVNWITGDNVTGPFATNGQMVVDGAPVFNGRATAVGGIKAGSAGDHAVFNGGFQSGAAVKVNVPTSLSYTESQKTLTLTPTSYSGSSYSYDVYLTFTSTGDPGGGSVQITTVDRNYSGSKWTTKDSTTVTDQLGSIANSYGQVVILVNNGDVHVQGTLTGDVTVVAEAGTERSYTATNSNGGQLNSVNGGTANGNVIIEGDMEYNSQTGPQLNSNDVEANPNSSDMLGLVADNSVVLDNQKGTSGVTIDAAIFCRLGSWTYLDYDNSIGSPYPKTNGTLNVLGSISQNVRGAVGTANSNGTVATGYVKNYIFDPRYVNVGPPAFPTSPGTFQLVYWHE